MLTTTAVTGTTATLVQATDAKHPQPGFDRLNGTMVYKAIKVVYNLKNITQSC